VRIRAGLAHHALLVFRPVLQLTLSGQPAHMLRVPAGQVSHIADSDPVLLHYHVPIYCRASTVLDNLRATVLLVAAYDVYDNVYTQEYISLA